MDLYTAIVSTATMTFDEAGLLIGLMVELNRAGVDVTHVCAALLNKSWGLGHLDKATLESFAKEAIRVIPDVLAGKSLREAKFYLHCFITAVPQSTLLDMELSEYEWSLLHRLRGGVEFANRLTSSHH